MIEAGPLVRLHVSLSRAPWRIAPAWAVLAGALAVGSPVFQPALALRVVAAVVLGDLAWGLVRRSGVTAVISASADQVRGVGLPYSQDNAPLSRISRALTLIGMTWQGVLAGLIFLLGGGLLIGLPAVALSVLAVLIGARSWSSARRGVTPAVSMALLDVLLPWLLGMFAVGWAYADATSRWPPLLVALGFTVLQWGILHAAASRAGQRSLAIDIGIITVLSVLIALRMPWAAAVVAVLLAPVAYWFHALEREDGSISACSGPWALIALLVAALALR